MRSILIYIYKSKSIISKILFSDLIIAQQRCFNIMKFIMYSLLISIYRLYIDV